MVVHSPNILASEEKATIPFDGATFGILPKMAYKMSQDYPTLSSDITAAESATLLINCFSV